MSNEVARMDTRHPMLRQLDMALDQPARDDEALDVSFMSRSFCLSGLPLRKQFERDRSTRKAVEPQREVTMFSRNDERFALTIASSPFVRPGGDVVQIGLPYGARARLLVLWMTTQARQPGRASGDRWLEIGRIDDWLEEVGIVPHPDAAAMAKEQMIRLAFTTFTMILKQERMEFFKSDKLITSAVFSDDDLPHYIAGNLAKVRFPLGIELSEIAYKRFTGSDVIPVSTEALRKISNNAMSIDVFLYLSYSLPYIAPGDSKLVTWQMLSRQFGNGETKSRFRQAFEPSIARALDAYRGANVEVTDEGLKLRYSDPIEAKAMFAAVPRAKPLIPPRVRNRIAPNGSDAVPVRSTNQLNNQLTMEL